MMKITDIYTESYRWPKPQVVTSGRGRGSTLYLYNSLNLVYIETDEGITGIGAGMGANNAEVGSFKPLLVGEDPINIERIYQKMIGGRLARYVSMISAIDIALWDLKAKVAGMPLYKLLGGVRNKLDCYIAGGYYAEGKTILDLQHEMEDYVQVQKARAVKMKVGGMTPYEDAKRVHAVRQVIGPDIKLLVDANCAWRVNEAMEFAKMVEEDRLFWFEEPLAAKDFKGFQTLAAHTSTPLAAGESLSLLDDEVALIDTGAIAFSQPDACLCGGVSMVMKLGNYCEARHINIAPHGSQQVHVHLNCALNNAAITEFYSTSFNHLAYTAFKYPVVINDDGTVSPSEAPGANFDIDPEVLAPYRVS